MIHLVVHSTNMMGNNDIYSCSFH